MYNDHKPLFFLAGGWGYRYLESGREGTCMVAWRALDENEYEHPNIAVPKPVFSAPCCSVERSARGLTRDMERGDPKVQRA